MARTRLQAPQLNTGIQAAVVATSETTTSTSYTDLTTTTDQVTVVVGASGILQVTIYCGMNNSGANYNNMSFALSGANTQAAADNFAIAFNGTNIIRLGATFTLTGLTPGSTTVKAKYSVNAGTGTFVNRKITAEPK